MKTKKDYYVSVTRETADLHVLIPILSHKHVVDKVGI